ncbi:MAG: GerMN domain-containing protein [Candidatus Saccharibacteria bacterium]
MKFKNIFLVAILVLIVGLVAFAAIRIFSGPEDTWFCQDGEWIKHGNPKDSKPESGCGPVNQSQQPEDTTAKPQDFLKNGYLVKNNPGLKTGVWYLTYEEPGKPAIVSELKFKSASMTDGLKVGDRVIVTGTKDGQIVTVTDIRKNLGDGSDKETAPAMRSVTLYYYNAKNDRAANADNPSCDRAYVLPVTRQIPVSETPIQDTINLLIKGELTALEKSAGFTTEFPNANLKLLGADLKSGTLTLDFTEVPGFTDGGSCRISLLQAQIEKTAKQFPEVKEVKYTKILWQP